MQRDGIPYPFRPFGRHLVLETEFRCGIGPVHIKALSPLPKGNCYDNACVESFFSSMTNELILRDIYRNRDEARRDVFEYIATFYNTRRLHQTLDYVSPVEFERQFRVA